jgi:hypothetical protein
VEPMRQAKKRLGESSSKCVGIPRFGGSAASESARPVTATAFILNTNSVPPSKGCKCGCHGLRPTFAAQRHKSTP